MNLKLYGAIALVVVALLGGVYGLWQRSEVRELRTHNAALENRVAGLLASERALRESAEVADRKRREAQALAARRKGQLDEALRQHQPWADAPVPDEVWNAVRP